MGEHAVVYGHPALIAAVDLRLTARLSPIPGPRGQVEIHLPQLGVTAGTSWAELAAYASSARERWQRYAAAPSPEAFDRVRGSDPAHLAKVALGEVALFVGDGDGPALRLEIDSALPIGSGFGSSAALAVAVLAGALDFRGAEAGDSELERLALEAERRQHGLPSGVDSATVLRGGILWAEQHADGRLALEALAADSPHLGRFRVLDTGTPAETTGAVVAAVRQRLEHHPERLRPVLERMGELVRCFRDELAAGTADPRPVLELVSGYEACLELLGVVPEPARRLIRDVERHGGAAKISGAGALSSPPGGIGAGSMLVYHPEPERIESWPFLDPRLRPLRLSLGAPGLRREEP